MCKCILPFREGQVIAIIQSNRKHNIKSGIDDGPAGMQGYNLPVDN